MKTVRVSLGVAAVAAVFALLSWFATVIGLAQIAAAVATLALLVAGVAFLVTRAATLRRPGERRRFFESTGTLLFLGILLLVHLFFAFDLVKLRFDVTRNGLYSLSAGAREELSRLDVDVQAELYVSRADADPLTELLGRMKVANRHFGFERVSAARQPGRAAEAGVDREGTLVLRHGERRLKILPGEFFRETPEGRLWIAEERILAGVRSLLRGRTPKVAFSQRHGERRLDDKSDGGLSQLRESLILAGYDCVGADLSAGPGLPPDWAAVCVVAPRQAPAPGVLARLREFRGRGGAILLALDPFWEAGPEAEEWNAFAAEQGVTLRRDLVIDPRDFLARVGTLAGNPLFPVLRWGDGEAFAAPRGRGFDCVFYTARSLDPAGLESVILSSGPDSLGLAHPPQPGRGLVLDASTDSKGPLVVAGLAKEREGRGRLVVFGDGDFTRNALLDVPGHRDLLIQSLALSMGLPPRPFFAGKREAKPLLRASQEEAERMTWLAFLLPVLAGVGGALFLLRRRRMSKAFASGVDP